MAFDRIKKATSKVKKTLATLLAIPTLFSGLADSHTLQNIQEIVPKDSGSYKSELDADENYVIFSEYEFVGNNLERIIAKSTINSGITSRIIAKSTADGKVTTIAEANTLLDVTNLTVANSSVNWTSLGLPGYFSWNALSGLGYNTNFCSEAEFTFSETGSIAVNCNDSNEIAIIQNNGEKIIFKEKDISAGYIYEVACLNSDDIYLREDSERGLYVLTKLDIKTKEKQTIYEIQTDNEKFDEYSLSGNNIAFTIRSYPETTDHSYSLVYSTEDENLLIKTSSGIQKIFLNNNRLFWTEDSTENNLNELHLWIKNLGESVLLSEEDGNIENFTVVNNTLYFIKNDAIYSASIERLPVKEPKLEITYEPDYNEISINVKNLTQGKRYLLQRRSSINTPWENTREREDTDYRISPFDTLEFYYNLGEDKTTPQINFFRVSVTDIP